MALTFWPSCTSTLAHQYMATQKAVTPMSTFWIILTVAATCRALGPMKAPAAATAPVASTVPPIQAPPRISGMPTQLMKAGMATIMMAVKVRDRPMDRVSSSFLARQAAAVAMAAEVPHTDMSAEMTMFRVREGILSTFWPKMKVLMSTMGVTTQATKMPGIPMARILWNSTSAPSSTRPVLMKYSTWAPSLTSLGVPTVLAMIMPMAMDQISALMP